MHVLRYITEVLAFLEDYPEPFPSAAETANRQ